MNSKEAEVQAKPLIIAHRLIFPTAYRAPAAGWIDPKNLGKADHGRNFWKTHIIYITHPGNFEDSAHEKFLKGQHMLIYYCGKKWGYYCRILHRCVESLPDWSHQPQIRWREVAWLPSLQLLYVGLVEKKNIKETNISWGWCHSTMYVSHCWEKCCFATFVLLCGMHGRWKVSAMEFSGFIPGLSESLFFQNGCNPLGSKTNQQKYHQVYNLVFLHPKTWTDSTFAYCFQNRKPFEGWMSTNKNIQKTTESCNCNITLQHPAY